MNRPLSYLLCIPLSIFLLIQVKSNAQTSLDDSTLHLINSDRIDWLIAHDSLYQATMLINYNIKYSKDNTSQLANNFNTLAKVFSKMGSYDTAEIYYLKALKIYNSQNNLSKKDDVLTNLANCYSSKNNYKKFDSIIPIAEKLSAKLNSINIFNNYSSKIKKNNNLRDHKAVLEYTTLALAKVNDMPFTKDDPIFSLENKKRLILSYQYYQALALIKLDQLKLGYKLLFDIDEKEFEKNVNSRHFSHNEIATLNYYKFRYFNEYRKDLKAANKYLLISDTYKYYAIKNLQSQTSKNGELIYKIITTQEKLKTANELRQKDQKISAAFLTSTIISSILVLVLAGFTYTYYKNRRRIKYMNVKLTRSNKKLMQIDKERLEFFSVLSHELRTPIYGISGLASLIEQEKDKEKKKSYLNSLISSSNYISTLIDNVLQATKLKFDSNTLRLKPEKISSIINNITDTVKAAAENKGLQIISNVEKSRAHEYVLADRVALSQILINLVYNSIRYTKEGFVSLEVREVGRNKDQVTLHFEVKDSGIGIKEENRHIVFNAFENKSFLNKNSSGTGLGLYIVKTLLANHNSEIDFSSVPNEGSSFFFTITFDTCAPPVLSAQLPVFNTSSKVLIVDDNKINLLITKKNIEKIPGYSCETVTNGEDAISVLKYKQFDLILMDINMPDMDGYDVTRQIRAFNPDIPIIALTALNSAEILNKAEQSGMNFVLNKPYNFEVFKTTIQNYTQILQY